MTEVSTYGECRSRYLIKAEHFVPAANNQHTTASGMQKTFFLFLFFLQYK